MLDGGAAAVWAAIEVGGLAESRNDGASWDISEKIGQWEYPADGLHPDVHSIDVHPARPDIDYGGHGRRCFPLG